MKHLNSAIILSLLILFGLNAARELQLITEEETNLLINNGTQLPQTYFLLVCYQKDIKCTHGDDEIVKAIDELKES